MGWPKGRRQTPEHRAALIKGLTGRSWKTGKPSWNRGLSLSNERRVKLSESHKGQTPWQRQSIPVRRTTDRDRERAAVYAKKVKAEVLAYYSIGGILGCRCGIVDLRVLSLDHINNDGAEKRRNGELGGGPLYAKLQRESYPLGYQTLCMNCQFIKHLSKGKSYGF